MPKPGVSLIKLVFHWAVTVTENAEKDLTHVAEGVADTSQGAVPGAAELGVQGPGSGAGRGPGTGVWHRGP